MLFSIQPKPSSLRRDPIVVGVREAARGELDVDQHQARLDPGHQQRLLAERAEAVAFTGLDDRVEDGERVVAADPHLVAEVAGVAGARDRDRRAGDLGLGVPEVRQAPRPRGPACRGWLASAGPGRRACRTPRWHPRCVTSSRPTRSLEVAEVGLGGGQQELVVGVAEDHAVLEHVATVVAPQRVLRAPGLAGPDVAGHHAPEEALGVAADDPVLVQRRGVEEAGAVADREVLVLRRHRRTSAPTGSRTSGPSAECR